MRVLAAQGSAATIDNSRVTVLSRIWKVLVVLFEDEGNLKRIDSGTKVIAMDTPNSESVRSDWCSYRTTVDAIEKTTGQDLLSVLSREVQ